MKKKYKTGYTTGSFDMFHVGHLNILKKSKELCDYLIVGVSTDELIEEYKNKKPVIPLEQRIAIVEAIKYVDKVVIQTTMDKFSMWENLHFDVIFHGDDWKGSDLYNKYIEEFTREKVDIIFFPHTKGISSTLLRNEK